MKYLITGGCGFLGSNLAEQVLQRGESLCVLDNLSRSGSVANLEWLRSKDELRFIHADIRNFDDVSRAVKSVTPDVIFHLAGQVAMTTSIANPRLDFDINARGTLNVLEAMRLYVPEATIVYSSTNKVYGDLEFTTYSETDTRYVARDYPNGFDESIPLSFHSPYGCSKGAADQYVQDYARIFGLKTVVCRHSSMYGGRQFSTYDQGWIGWFCQQALDVKNGTLKDPFTISGNGKQVRDVLNVEDIKRLYFNVIEHIEETSGQVFNIGGGMENSLSLLELFGLLREILDVELSYTQLPCRQSDQKVFVADNSKANRVLSWCPQVAQQEGIRRMLQWLSSGI